MSDSNSITALVIATAEYIIERERLRNLQWHEIGAHERHEEQLLALKHILSDVKRQEQED